MAVALNDLPFPTAILRPGRFYENFAAALPAGLGRVAACWEGRKTVEIVSRVSTLDIACAFSEALGRPVRAEAVPRDQWTATLEAFGMRTVRPAATRR